MVKSTKMSSSKTDEKEKVISQPEKPAYFYILVD